MRKIITYPSESRGEYKIKPQKADHQKHIDLRNWINKVDTEFLSFEHTQHFASTIFQVVLRTFNKDINVNMNEQQ